MQLAELADVVHRQLIARQMQQRIRQQIEPCPFDTNEAVAIWPVRIRRVVAQVLRPRAPRRSAMPIGACPDGGFGSGHCIDRKHADGIGGGVQGGGGGRGRGHADNVRRVGKRSPQQRGLARNYRRLAMTQH